MFASLRRPASFRNARLALDHDLRRDRAAPGLIETVLIRNEQAGAFAADGYARVTGRPGVVCTTAGPGATNALTGVAECWADSVPILLVSGQVNAATLDRECGNYHEIDLERIFQPATKWCGTVRAVEQIPSLLASAFQAMTTGRAATGCDLPSARPDAAPPAPSRCANRLPTGRTRTRAGSGHRASRRAALDGASAPIILAGGGALWSGAAEAIGGLARRLDAPVLTTLNGKGLLDERHPFSLGHARSARAKAALPHADAMLAVGCRFTEVMTDWRRMTVPANLIQIDLDSSQIGMNFPVRLGIVADAQLAVEAISAALPASARRATAGARSGKRPDPRARPGPSGSSKRCELPCPAMFLSSPTPAKSAIACTPTGSRTGRGCSSTRQTLSRSAGHFPQAWARLSPAAAGRLSSSAAMAAF